MAATRKPTNNAKNSNSLNCVDAKSYLCQGTTKNDANLYVYNRLLLSIRYVLKCLMLPEHCVNKLVHVVS